MSSICFIKSPGKSSGALLLLLFAMFANAAENHFRLLVLLTPATKAYYRAQGIQIKSYISDFVFASMNISFSNSKTNTVVDNAGIVEINFTEGTDICSDRDKINNNPTAQQLRKEYAADIVGLVAYSNFGYFTGNGCSVAGIGGPDNAYVAGKYDLSFDPIIFSHEVGHVFGCQHDLAHDANDYWPCKCSHGFYGDIHPDGVHFGSIMSYTGKIRPYYSNPDILWKCDLCGAQIYIGNAQANNASIIRGRASVVGAFVQPQADIAFSNRVWASDDFADAQATNSITVSGTSAVQSNSEVWLRANNSVTIGSGFTVAKGGALTIRAGVTALAKKGAADESPKPPVINPSSTAIPDEFSLQIAISAGSKSFAAHYSLPRICLVNLQIHDMAGRLVFQRDLGKKNQGKYMEEIPVNALRGGTIYLFKFRAGTYEKTLKVIPVQ
jgi:hypothetical protein